MVRIPFVEYVIHVYLLLVHRSTIGRGDPSRDTAEELFRRLSLTYTLITIQSCLGFLLSIVFLFAAPGFVGAFVPGQVRATSVKYLRILAFDALASTLNTAVSFGTRALDKPE
jgi:Na+-driven multidrug efflux pump